LTDQERTTRTFRHHPTPEREIEAAIASVRKQGYCVAAWQPGVVAIATPLVSPDRPVYALNMSVGTGASAGAIARRLNGELLALRADLLDAMSVL
jgi:DNA-binding IclR family transcriptional regulator